MSLKELLDRWREHPRRWDLLYMAGSPYRNWRNQSRRSRERRALLVPDIDVTNVEILRDPAFRSSVAEARRHSLLDVGRLVNLWNMARLVGPGLFLEVGSYRGGGALHICNAIAGRNQRFLSFDPFESGGFQSIQEDDTLFEKDQFTDTSLARVKRLLSRHPNASVVQGYFPAAAEPMNLDQIAFCHLDVDVYEATRMSLAYLAPRMAPRSLIILDDIHRNVQGVDRAVAEFLAEHRDFIYLPIFPSQGILLCKNQW